MDQPPFNKGRCLLLRDDFLRGTFLCCELPYYLIRLTYFHQVLTGVLPFDDEDRISVKKEIRLGRRPSRPTDPSRNQWLHDQIWDTITACWNGKPGQRPELSVVYHAFSTASLNDAMPDEPDDLDIQISVVQDSEPGIERVVNEMDKVDLSTFLPSSNCTTNVSCSASRTPLSRVGNG